MIKCWAFNGFSQMKKLILQIIVRISILLCPYKLSRYLDKLRNTVVSRRFCYLSHNKDAKVYMEYPFYIYGHSYIKCGNFSSRAGLRLECWDKYEGKSYSPSLVIGANVCFNFRCHVGVINKVVIGNNVLIGSNVLITDHSHGHSNEEDIEIQAQISEICCLMGVCKNGEIVINEITDSIRKSKKIWASIIWAYTNPLINYSDVLIKKIDVSISNFIKKASNICKNMKNCYGDACLLANYIEINNK